MSELTRLNMIQLEIVVRIAALPADQQIAALPRGVVVADEIALDFDNYCQWALKGCDAPELTDEQRTRLISLDGLFDDMTRRRKAKLWTEDAMRTRPEWAAVREEATKILEAFGWPINE
jgi:hypothetical protein